MTEHNHPQTPSIPSTGHDDTQLIETWYALGQANRWIALAADPPFTRQSFCKCHTLGELKARFEYGNWCLGQAFYYQDVCFINQVNGGDEWLTIRHGIAFESIAFGPSFRNGSFEALIERLLKASEQQCRRLEY